MRNPSGLSPVEYKVVVLQDTIEEKTEGGIYLPQDTRDKKQMGEVNGTLIACGGLAFFEGLDGMWPDPVPEPGDRVLVSKYAGFFFEGKDGKMYQCCQDKDILGIWEKEKKDGRRNRK